MKDMPRGLNKVLLIGWLDSNPELRYTPGGRPVVSFSVGTSRTWNSGEGEVHEETEWFNVVVWGNLAEACNKGLTEGQQVYVEGRLQTRSWEDSQGRKHFRTEVVAHDVVPLTDYYVDY
jgi:single-strand DNA-binding protein